MKKFSLTWLLVGAAFAAFATGLITSQFQRIVALDYLIGSTNDSQGLIIQKGGVCNSNLIEAYKGSTLVFAVNSNGIVGTAYGGTGSTSGGGNFTNAVFVGGTSSGLTNSDLAASLPMFSDASLHATNKTVAATKLALGIQSGSTVSTTDGTVTNTFAQAYASGTVPNVSIVPITAISPITNRIVSVSSNQFIWLAGTNNITNSWVAVGTP